MRAIDIMTPDVITATPDTTVGELVRLMLDNRISGLPIVEDGRLVGMVSEGDLLERPETGTQRHRSHWAQLVVPSSRLAAEYTKSHGLRASEVMTHDVITVEETAPIGDIAALFATQRIKRVPVMRDGRLVGIVSRRNLLQALASRLTTAAPAEDDRAIRDAFYAELRGQAWIDSPGAINAVVCDGVVHLWGIAPDEARRRAIVAAAESLPGVRAVEDHMDRPVPIDPLNRPNWPTPMPA
jgi:CBS domain-containing protein